MATPGRPVVLVSALALAGLVGGCAIATVTVSTACRDAAEIARDRAMAAFDLADPAPLSYAHVVTRPSRRLEVGRLAYDHALDACRAGELGPSDG